MDKSCITCVSSEEPPFEVREDMDRKSISGSLSTMLAVFGITLLNEVITHILE